MRLLTAGRIDSFVSISTYMLRFVWIHNPFHSGRCYPPLARESKSGYNGKDNALYTSCSTSFYLKDDKKFFPTIRQRE